MRKINATSSPKQFRRPTPFLLSPSDTALPDCVIVPEQFFAPSGHSAAHRSGVKRLLFAVLQDAVACWFRYRYARHARGQRLFRETQAWFWATEQDSLFAFEHICAQLQLDPDYIRQGLLRWQTTFADRPRPCLRTASAVRNHYFSPIRA